METKIRFQFSILMLPNFHYISVYPNDTFPNESEQSCVVRVESKYGEYKLMNFNGRTIRILPSRSVDTFSICSDNKFDESIFVLDYLMELFPTSKLSGLKIGEGDKQAEKTLIKWIKRRNSSEVEYCRLWYCFNSRDFLNLVDSIQITSGLTIIAQFPAAFKCQLPENLQHFECYYSKWITKNQLLKMNYEYFMLCDTEFQNQDGANLVNKCINGDLPALRFARIEINSLNLDELVKGVSYERTESRLECIVKPTRYSLQEYPMKGRYEYKMSDSKILTISQSSRDFLEIYIRSK
ncbi:unnamed protein product [Caenorhabditis brenneri]